MRSKQLFVVMKSISRLEKMLAVAILFTMTLLLARFYYTGTLTYGFYGWNTFLAILPVLISRLLVRLRKFDIKAVLWLGGWLAFFPNAPYLVTDLFHYTPMPPVPQWFDLMLVTSAAWNGLLLGIISLMQVEQFLSAHLKAIWVKLIVISSFALCGYGVYIGRYLRFNTWDTVTNPGELLYTIAHHVMRPQQHVSAWAFTFLFGVMFGIIYFTLQQLGGRLGTLQSNPHE